jgi:hypothetical protein
MFTEPVALSRSPKDTSEILTSALVPSIVGLAIMLFVILYVFKKKKRILAVLKDVADKQQSGIILKVTNHYKYDLRRKDIDESEVLIGEKIGGGNYGRAYKAKFRGTDVSLRKSC